MWLYDWESLTPDNHTANIGGFRHCGSGDKMFCDFMGGRPF